MQPKGIIYKCSMCNNHTTERLSEQIPDISTLWSTITTNLVPFIDNETYTHVASRFPYLEGYQRSYCNLIYSPPTIIDTKFHYKSQDF